MASRPERNDEREGVIARARPASTPQEARDRRGQSMTGVGAVSLVVAFFALLSSAPIGFLFALLGVGLLVGGLILRR